VSKGFIQGYSDGGTKDVKPYNLNNRPVEETATVKEVCEPCDNGFSEGYVDGGIKDIKPYNPNNRPIEEIVIIPPSSSGGGILFVQPISSVNNTSLDGDLITSETFSFLPLPDSDMWITINGVAAYPANGSSEISTSLFYITDSTNSIVRPKGTYQIGDIFHWNGSLAYELESDDEIKIIYEINL
jgi:hypothetical protein